jgi:hypothetical protein
MGHVKGAHMAEFTYPSNGLERAQFLLGLLGSHWTNVYQGNHLVERYAFSRAQEELQAYQDLMELVASVSRFEVPIYHADNWYFLVIKESELNSLVLKYGDGAIYGDQPDGTAYRYGEPTVINTGLGYTFPIPTDLVDARNIFNRLSAPSLTYTKGVDFTLAEGVIAFAANPFDDDRVAKRDIVEGSEVVDREAGLWVFKGQLDWDHIYTHFGYVLGLRLESSTEYRDFLNAILDALVRGTCEKDLQLAFAAITGTPIVVEPEETVELIKKDLRHLVIVTDQHVYKFQTSAEPIVTVGDTVYGGDQLVDTVTFYDLNRGETPGDLYSVTMGLGFLPGGFVDGLTFLNQDVALVVTEENGRPRVEFELGGLPTDVERFWDLVHEKGVLDGTTLANLLDGRIEPSTEPIASNLPATVNPLEFLIENVLRYNAYIVKIKVSNMGTGLSLSNTRLLRKIIPPWTTMILILELTSDESIEMDGDGTEETPGYSEDTDWFIGADPVEETIDPSASVTERVSIRPVGGICL